MHNSTREFEATVLVRGKPVTEVVHNGQTFIEGRRGSSYELYFRNNTRNRVLVVPSVDGLSVIDGEPAGVDSSGYVVEPHTDITIPGWAVNSSEAAEFLFHAQNSSRMDEETYVEATGNDERNQGVIGFMVFREVRQRVSRSKRGAQVKWPMGGARPRSGSIKGSPVPRGAVHDEMHVRHVMEDAVYNYSSQTIGSSIGGTVTTSTTMGGADAMGNIPNSGQWVNVDFDADKSLGTGFGDAVEFETQTVEFRREPSHCAVFAFYYDTIKNLRKAGVPVEQFRRHYTESYETGPNPFPQSPEVTGYATPPRGWQGGRRYKKRRS